MSTQLPRRDVLRLGAAAVAVPAGLSGPAAAAQAAPPPGDPLPAGTPRPGWVADRWQARPLALNQVALGDGVFRQKRDRILNYARNYPGTGNVLDGPNRLLVTFRNNAGLDTGGYQAPGGWDTPTSNLRGHYTGHFMTMLAQCYADTGEDVFVTKLDYLVTELGKVQDALADRIANPPQPEPVGRVPGRSGTAVRLNGPTASRYVAMPPGVLAGLGDFTVAAWVNLAEAQTWSRIFDFGTGTTANMFLTVRTSSSGAGAAPRFAITTSGGDGEQRIAGNAPLPVGTWVHVAVTRSGSTGTLYVDGAVAGTNTGLTLGPSDLGTTTNNWIGQSQYADPSLNGTVDEFHIYDRALSAAQIQALQAGTGDGGNVAAYRFDETGGDTVTDSSGRGRDATVVVDADDTWVPSHPGYLAAFPEGQYIRLEPPTFQNNSGPNAVWAPWYTFHKVARGLLDAYYQTGNTQALEIVSAMGDWAHSRLSRIARADLDRMWNIYSAGETGGANEVMTELAALTDDPVRKAAFLTTAKAFDFSTIIDANVAGQDILNGRHANTFVPAETGHLRIYEATGEQRYLSSARNFWGMVVPHRVWSQGGTSGPGEFFRQRGVIAGHLRSASTGTTFAETCTAYNMLKLTRNLYFHDPRASYFDFYERGLYNQILGSKRDIDSDLGPWVTYHQNLWPGASRQPDWTRYVGQNGAGSCCTGTGLENHTKYQESIYATSADGSTLFVNLYVASTLDWSAKGVEIQQQTAFPEDSASTLRVLRGGATFTVRLRVPGWVRKGFVVTVNGHRQHLQPQPGEYVALTRRWSAGDRIDIAMPLSFRTERAPDDPAVQSLFYGPTLMVSLGGAAPPIAWRQFGFYRHHTLDGDFGNAFTATATPMHFTSQGHVFAPFYVADPNAFTAYHAYFERAEPQIVFGSEDSGVPNRDRGDGWRFLDLVWQQAPFADHGHFVRRVEEVSRQWEQTGLLSRAERDAVLQAAARARRELEP